MKKYWIVSLIIAVVVVFAGATGLVYAQTPTSDSNTTTNNNWMMNGRGSRFGQGNSPSGIGPNFMSAYFNTAFAEKLGISIEDLSSRLSKGETLPQIAASKGITTDKYTTFMNEVHTLVIEKAMKDGKITQQQADWMNQRSHSFGRNGNGGYRSGPNRGTPGTGLRQNADPLCPYYIPSVP